MKLIVLADNRCTDASLETEHGLCLYVETNTTRYLLDTGRTDVFIRNAERLGVDLTAVDYVFLSHAHADHTGGLEAFLALNETATVLLHPAVISDRYFSSRQGGFRDISLPFDLTPWLHRCRLVEDDLLLEDGTFIYACHTEKFATPKANVTLWKGVLPDPQRDTFDHELMLVVGGTNGLLYTGCAHKGLLNMLAETSGRGLTPGWVVGGFHLLDSLPGHLYEDAETIHHIAEWLSADYPDTHFLTGHCTGDAVFERMKTVMGAHLHQFYTGLRQIMA
jgi:7,8-dihydropterin-6-yl-methyl-4-(beta-D-ribofuranosyl)aminobenzene 5'-phosphate synthase